MVARNEDSPNGTFNPKRLVTVDPTKRKSYTSVLGRLTVPLPDGGARYTAMPNVDLKEGLWEEAGINAHNVGMSENRSKDATTMIRAGPASRSERTPTTENTSSVGNAEWASSHWDWTKGSIWT